MKFSIVTVSILAVASAAPPPANIQLKAKRNGITTLKPSNVVSHTATSDSSLSFPVISPTLIVKKKSTPTHISSPYKNSNYEIIASASTLYPKEYKVATPQPTNVVNHKAHTVDRIIFGRGIIVDESKKEYKVKGGVKRDIEVKDYIM